MKNGDSHSYSLPEADVWDSRALLASIVDSSDDAIVSKNLDGIVTSWNKAAERLFGYSAHEMIGTPISVLFPKNRLDEEPAILEKLRRGQTVDHFETVRLHKSGAPLNISVTISPVRDSTGRIIGASKVARDVTEQKRSQKEMATLIEGLQRAHRMNSEFFGVISHELRTPLNAIVGWTQILRDKSSTPALVEQGLSVIEQNAWSQVTLINDLLDMSRMISGNFKLDLQRIDLAVILRLAVEAAEPTAKAKGVRLSTAVAAVAGEVVGDQSRMLQILGNLLSNAIKFTPSGGRVHVALERVSSHMEITVSDTGGGISADFLPYVFERFRQEESGSRRKTGGLGLGLSIVKQLTELQGGVVRAHSNGHGQGATFSIELPVVADQAPRQVAAPTEASSATGRLPATDLSGTKVLVVDDESASCEVVKYMLEQKMAVVESCDSVGKAIAMFAKFRPNIVITDIGMPERDGFDLLHSVRSLSGGGTVPFVALTALARPEDRTRVLRAGFQMYLTKPLLADDLVAVVANLVQCNT